MLSFSRLSFRDNVGLPKASFVLVALAVGTGLFACSKDVTGLKPVEVATISIDTPSVQLERGSHQVFTATARDSTGKVVIVPFVWRSSAESVATIDVNGRVTARNEGISGITASSLGVTSSATGIRVVWQGAAKLAAFSWTPPAAATPSTIVGDSIHVSAIDKSGNPAPGSKIVFAVTAGGGKVSPTTATTDANGLAATQWTSGPANGVNTVTATVVDDDGIAIPWVNPNQVSFSATTFKALEVVNGSQQTATILSTLPVAPSVRLLDAAGKPRAGVPVNFQPTAGGLVAFPIVSTGIDGVASPGTWTLGDIPGDQSVIATVESATITVHATATGTPIRLSASLVSAGGSATCALATDGPASCWGFFPLVGAGDTVSQTKPTPTVGGINFKTISVGLSHVCGISTDQSLYCWGINAFADVTGKTNSSLRPTLVAADLKWSDVATGAEHTCALATDGTPYCWGLNEQGQLGIAIADTITRFVATAVYGGFKFGSITAGISHTCGLTIDRTAFCWGLNASGQLGDGSLLSRVAPTVVAGGLTFKSIGAGEQWTCGLTVAGKAYCWGFVPGVSQAQRTPLAYSTAPTFVSLAVGGAHACALTGDGTAYCWGANNGGQLGDSTATTRTVPTKVAGNFKFASISAGDAHTCGRLTDNTVMCWGLNRFGEIGDDKAAFRLAPRYIVLGVNP